jgi:hypothetical protein
MTLSLPPRLLAVPRKGDGSGNACFQKQLLETVSRARLLFLSYRYRANYEVLLSRLRCKWAGWIGLVVGSLG